MLSHDSSQASPPPHYIKPNHGNRAPVHCIFAAASTRREREVGASHSSELFVQSYATYLRRDGSKWTRRKVHESSVANEIWAWIVQQLNRRSPTFLCAFDAGSFLTVTGFWDMMDRGEFQLIDPTQWRVENDNRVPLCKRPFRGCCIISDPPVLISASHKNGRVRIVGLDNYFPGEHRWRNAGSNCERPMESEAFNGRHNDGHSSRDKAIYAERLMTEAISDWHESDCGCWQSTAAGLAFTSWRHTLKRGEVLVKHGHHTDYLERRSYMAGRCEAFFIGSIKRGKRRHSDTTKGNASIGSRANNGTVYQLDIRSFYPWLMTQLPYPVRLLAREQCADVSNIKQHSLVHLPIADVWLETNEPLYPYRGKSGLLWPIGSFRTVLCGPELQIAIERKHIVSVHAVAWYAPGWPFTAWVGKWFSKRMEAHAARNEPRELFCKMILNSLHGKLGSKPTIWQDEPNHAAHYRWGSWHETDAVLGCKVEFRAIAGNVQRNIGRRDGRDSCPAISSYVSSYGRVALLNLMQECPDRSVLYCDTDSLIVTQSGLDALSAKGLVGGTHLGALRIVAEAKSIEIRHAKDYTLDHKIISAGRKENAVSISPTAYMQDVYCKLPTLLSAKPDGTVRVNHVVMRTSRRSSLRAVGPDGWTMPIVAQPYADSDSPYASALLPSRPKRE